MNTFASNLDPAGHHRQPPPDAQVSSGYCYGKGVQRHQSESILNNKTSNWNESRTNENLRPTTMVPDFPELQKSYEYYSRPAIPDKFWSHTGTWLSEEATKSYPHNFSSKIVLY